MESRLNRIQDWQAYAKSINYSSTKLAKKCGVTVRQLERYFLNRFKMPPHEWLHTSRMKRAVELMCDGCAVKETATLLGYKTSAHFCHDFKQTYHVSPTQYVTQQLIR
jgi:AraC-like DNA-binding protein